MHIYGNQKLDYRSMFNNIIGPILKYSGFILNKDGIIQRENDNVGIVLSGRHLYVPFDGEDYFKVKDSTLLVPFNPFKFREHTLILADLFCKTLSNHFRDEDDEYEYNAAGDLIDIVSLVKRHAKTEDLLPATFKGVIYEIWCRDEHDVLGKGIDDDGNDIKAILICMLNILSKYSNIVEKDINFNKVFQYVERVEKVFELEVDEARMNMSRGNSDFEANATMDDVEVNSEEEIVEEESDEDDDIPEDYSQYDFGSRFDEVDLF